MAYRNRKTEIVLQCFEQSNVTKKSKCLIENCNVLLKTNLVYNLKRHIVTNHPHVAKDLELSLRKPEKIEKIQIHMDENTFIKGCVIMTTSDHLPFSILDEEGFLTITKPIQDVLNITINAGNIQKYIDYCADEIKKIIKDEIKNKMVCLKIDTATLFEKSVLVINVQYLEGRNISLKTLGVIELTIYLTSENIRNNIIQVLNDFNIELSSVYCFTTDNGANMLKCVKLIQEQFPTEILDKSEELFQHADKVTDAAFVENLNASRCVAHVLQLAVDDVLKDQQDSLQKIRKIVKELEKPSYRDAFLMNKKRQPMMDVITKWITTYDMITCLTSEKTFITNILSEQEINDENTISDEMWCFMNNIQEALKFVFEATNLLQEKHLTMGDFYRKWLECEILLEELTRNEFANQLLQAMNERKKIFLDNVIVLAALYLDPRFNFNNSKLLSEMEKVKAKFYLKSLWEKICQSTSDKNNEDQHNEDPNDKDEIQQEPEPSTSLLEMYMYAKSGPSASIPDTFGIKLDTLCYRERMNVDFSVFQYWEEKKQLEPELYAISQIVLAAPSSQVSVERSFSALSYILTKPQINLSPTDLSNILMVILNDDILDKFELENRKY